MTLFEWLVTPQGQALVSAVIAVLLAIQGYLNWRIHQQVKDNSRLLQDSVAPSPGTKPSVPPGEQAQHVVDSQDPPPGVS